MIDQFPIVSENIKKITLNCTYQLDRCGLINQRSFKDKSTITLACSGTFFTMREIIDAVKLIYNHLSSDDDHQLSRKFRHIEHHIKIIQVTYSRGKLTLDIQNNATVYNPKKD